MEGGQWDLRHCDEDQILCYQPKQSAGGCHLSSVWCYQESQTSQGCCSFLPGNVRVSFEDQRGQIPSEKVTSSMQPESARGCALPAADH